MSETQTSPNEQSLQPPKIHGIIDIGATSIRMTVAESADSHFQILDNLFQSISLGRDVFTDGYIKGNTIKECIGALKNFLTAIQEYAPNETPNLHVYATTAVREASNRDAFLDRISMATGLEIIVLSGNETNRMTYYSVKETLDQLNTGNTPVVVIEIGGGATDILVIHDGKVSESHALRLGTLRLHCELDVENDSISPQMIYEEIEKFARNVSDNLYLEEIPKILFIGSEARLIAQELGNPVQAGQYAEVSVAGIEKFRAKILEMNAREVHQNFHIPIGEVELTGTAVIAHELFCKVLGAKRAFVGASSLREGILKELAGKSTWTPEFMEQLTSAVIEIGHKYDFEQDHAQAVSKIALRLFDDLEKEHKLNYYHRTLLHVAALLHDIGTFISPRSHHKHSMYLIRNAEIFGFGSRELNIVSLLARYHRRASPNAGHSEFAQLHREDRFMITKLASILRVADALDRTHTGRCTSCEFRFQGDDMEILVKGASDFTLERQALKSKAKLFSQVYGKEIRVIAQKH